MFVGHPLQGTEPEFEGVGKMLKKNNVSISVINFAHPDNVSRLQTLVDSANQGQDEDASCHFMDIAPGCNITDVIISSPIVMSEQAAMGGGADASGANPGAAANDPLAALGIDPHTDPELAQAILMSLREQE